MKRDGRQRGSSGSDPWRNPPRFKGSTPDPASGKPAERPPDAGQGIGSIGGREGGRPATRAASPPAAGGEQSGARRGARDGPRGRDRHPTILPWYRGHPGRDRPHAGLVFDKFCDVWDDSGDTGTRKRDFIEAVIAEYQDNRDLQVLVEGWCNRRRALIAALAPECKQPTAIFTTTEPLVTGFGMNHVLDNGFVWHATLSVPYLPGSGVKGIIRAWVDPDTGWSDEEQWDTARRLFGDAGEPGRPGSGVGSLVVFEALPVTVPAVAIDVMNVHHQRYYQHGEPPGDYEAPVPVYFLTVAAGATFEFGLAPRPGVGTPDDVQLGFALLRDALSVLGFGAKTAVGYGRLTSESPTRKPDR